MKTDKNADYHESAIAYNRKFAEFAESLSDSEDIPNETVRGWVASIGRQHRFHEDRHTLSLKKMIAESENEEEVKA